MNARARVPAAEQNPAKASGRALCSLWPGMDVVPFPTLQQPPFMQSRQVGPSGHPPFACGHCALTSQPPRPAAVTSCLSAANPIGSLLFGSGSLCGRVCLCRKSVLANYCLHTYLIMAVALDVTGRIWHTYRNIVPSVSCRAEVHVCLISRGPGLARDLQDPMLSNF